MKWLLLFLMMLVAPVAMACECGEELTSEMARKAPNVFVFRVISLEVGEVDGTRYAVGKIRVIANVRGKTVARAIYYRTGWCCGISMSPGLDYIGFLPSDSERFEVTTATVIRIFMGQFDRREADELEALLRGRKTLTDAFPLGPRAITRDWPLAPPCSVAEQRQ
ncbi:hypothetical protein [Pseudoxanthomonas sp. PXM01]|uniref:hypothetical protein n=1 Tax=Pseudoxanthomonas sp. PXM01 TaxID=2769295 RepID=UPI0017844CB4|nr:hypothetical protein [Pseudoxanthomonas sp. PXM01]MBD9470683.1 hypothetical protein [Pseudoxanthomonas sp. PXM01]